MKRSVLSLSKFELKLVLHVFLKNFFKQMCSLRFNLVHERAKRSFLSIIIDVKTESGS